MKQLLIICLIVINLFAQASLTAAIEDPHAKPNNKIGIHILFDHELSEAAKLINSSGGDWGYVTMPIQIGDRDLEKWQSFMNKAREFHVIPLIRLASEGDYFNTRVWKKPTFEDVVDFANFLDSLEWPTKNRYVIVFNETNRADEWGGEVNPSEYAQILSFAVSVFKSKNPDFFIINGGLDNAAPDEYPQYMNQYTYMRAMQEAVPGIFNQIDGYASHSYPNPGFSQPPHLHTSRSIASFIYEREYIRTVRNSEIPIFITETGWNAPGISDQEKAVFYKQAFADVWNDPMIVAVTPFLLRAGAGPFQGFSFFTTDGAETEQYKAIKELVKTKGKPTLTSTKVLTAKEENKDLEYPRRNFSESRGQQSTFSISETAQAAFRWIMKL